MVLRVTILREDKSEESMGTMLDRHLKCYTPKVVELYLFVKAA